MMKTVIAMTAAALVTVAGAAQAQTAEPNPAVRVSYADLDLARADGRAVLEARVRRAVDVVCPARPLPAETGKVKAYRACKGQALAGAQQQIAAIYNGRQLAQSAIRVGGQD